jgi:serine/threonine protein kinase
MLDLAVPSLSRPGQGRPAQGQTGQGRPTQSRPGAATVLAERYRLDHCIAIGGMGEVWRGEDLRHARPVAIKLMRPGYVKLPEATARFKAEARYGRRLSHDGIVRVRGHRHNGRPFLVMELIRGPSLAITLSAGPLTPERALDVIAQVAQALHAAHSAGVIHCDVKPANLLLRSDGQVKLIDFGIARSVGSMALTSAGTVLGTPAYLAPERLAGQPATVAVDLYALGVVLYEGLAGGRPFTGTATEIALAHQTRPIPPLPSCVPAMVVSLVTDLMAKDPAARPASAAQVSQRAIALRAALRAAQCADA